MDGAESNPQLQQVNPTPAQMSLLDLVNDCDNFPYPETDPELYNQYLSTYFMFYIPPCSRPVGYVLPSVALTLNGIEGWVVDESERKLTLQPPKAKNLGSSLFPGGYEGTQQGVDLDLTLTLEQKRSKIIANTAAAMRETGHFEVLDKWRDELYPIYWKPQSASAGSGFRTKQGKSSTDSATDVITPVPASSGGQAEMLASMERSASPLFGIVTYGCHLTAYVRQPPRSTAEAVPRDTLTSGYDDLWVWVPRRSRTKGTYPSMLDQTVAGGIPSGETSWDSLVREAAEEASLPEELIRRKARAVGTVSYFHVRDRRAGGETRLMQPECQYCYDLDLTGEKSEDGNDIQPRPNDDEVEGFELMDIEAVKTALARGEFKPNCALVLIDFLVRHGVVTAENEPDYNEIIMRLRRRLEFPMS